VIKYHDTKAVRTTIDIVDLCNLNHKLEVERLNLSEDLPDEDAAAGRHPPTHREALFAPSKIRRERSANDAGASSSSPMAPKLGQDEFSSFLIWDDLATQLIFSLIQRGLVRASRNCIQNEWPTTRRQPDSSPMSNMTAYETKFVQSQHWGALSNDKDRLESINKYYVRFARGKLAGCTSFR